MPHNVNDYDSSDLNSRWSHLSKGDNTRYFETKKKTPSKKEKEKAVK